jgi:hypothetical protein
VIESLIFAIVALVLLLAVLWVAWRPMAAPPAIPESSLPIEELFPLHSRHFPQVRQALSQADAAFLRERASARIQRRVRAERREVAREFLHGLAQDFTRLDRLGRVVAAVSPVVSRQQEVERLRLGLRFRLLYGLAWLRLGMGGVSVPQLARLTQLVGSLAAQIEGAMAALEDAGMMQARSRLNA